MTASEHGCADELLDDGRFFSSRGRGGRWRRLGRHVQGGGSGWLNEYKGVVVQQGRRGERVGVKEK